MTGARDAMCVVVGLEEGENYWVHASVAAAYNLRELWDEDVPRLAEELLKRKLKL